MSPQDPMAGSPSPFRTDLLAGRVALVTGGGTGIGRGIALELARHGADLVLASRSPDHLEPTAGEIRALGRRALVRPFDVRDPVAVREGVQAALAELGRIDIVVNNAAGNFLVPAAELSPNGWRAVVEIVLDGTFHVSRAVFEAMRRQGGGAIVNVTTTYVDTGAALMAHSGAAKAGVLNLTRSLAAEWGPFRIRLNAVAPGLVEGTEGARRLAESVGILERARSGVPMGRLTRTEDVARAVLFLASPAAEHVTGAELVVDGGARVGGTLGEWIGMRRDGEA
jgi:2,4-dienoyl-CoA reductase [(3E)-enoyl-CoA-producing], peroxisomal